MMLQAESYRQPLTCDFRHPRKYISSVLPGCHHVVYVSVWSSTMRI
jgi:hypothetical protein